MKAFITAFLATVFLAASAQACMGGNLLQVMDDDNNTVVATYNIVSGELLAMNKSYSVRSVTEYVMSDGNQEGANLCATQSEHCTKLAEMENRNIVVVFTSFDSANSRMNTGMKIIENVSVGPNVPTTRGMAKGMIDLLSPIGCSKK